MITRPNRARKVREKIIDKGQNNRRHGKVVFFIPEKGMRRKRRNICVIFLRWRKKGEGKGGKSLEKENIFFA